MRLPLSDLATKGGSSTRAGPDKGAGGGPRSPLPDAPLSGFFSAAGASAGGAGGGLIAFALLLSLFLLVIPNAVRWLRTALALGLSPAYLAIGERPG